MSEAEAVERMRTRLIEVARAHGIRVQSSSSVNAAHLDVLTDPMQFLYNPSLPGWEQCSVIAHELGHYFLAHPGTTEGTWDEHGREAYGHDREAERLGMGLLDAIDPMFRTRFPVITEASGRYLDSLDALEADEPWMQAADEGSD